MSINTFRGAIAKRSLNNFFKVDEAPPPHKYKRRGRRFYIMALIGGFLQQPLEGVKRSKFYLAQEPAI